MSKQISNFIAGKMGPLVGYQAGGKYLVRMHVPHPVQTAATKKRSSNFGIASRAGKVLRQLLKSSIPIPTDRTMQRALGGAIAKWLALSSVDQLAATDAIPFVKGFNFTPDTFIAERWKLPLQFTQPTAELLQLYIPSFKPAEVIVSPMNTIAIQCSISFASCTLASGATINAETTTLHFMNDNNPVAEQTLSFAIPAQPGTVVVTAIMLGYKLSNGKFYDKPAFMPASIVDARYY